MRLKTTGLALAALMTLSACGIPTDPGLGVPEDPDAPVVQITSEGGFAPIGMILGRGPLYTLLADGRLIYEGPQIAIYPGPLLPNYQVTRISDGQMSRILDLVEEIGLPDMDREIDDSASSRVADATTEAITYWDENGEHTYAVYALGIDLDESPPPATRAFSDLFAMFGDLTTGEATPYEPERVRIIVGPGHINEEFQDIREWPLEDQDLSSSEMLPNGWLCDTVEPSALGVFTDATQATVWRWTTADPALGDTDLYTLLVRPLHPGEPGCPVE